MSPAEQAHMSKVRPPFNSSTSESLTVALCPDHRKEANAGLYEALLGPRRTMLHELRPGFHEQGIDGQGGESLRLLF